MKVDKRREIFPLGPKQRNTLAAAGVFERYNVSCSNQTALHYRSSPDGLYVAISLLVEDLRRRLYPDQQWIKHAYTHVTAHPIGVAWEYLVLFAHFVFTSLHVSPTNKRPSRLFHGPRAYHFGIPHTPVPRPRRTGLVRPCTGEHRRAKMTSKHRFHWLNMLRKATIKDWCSHLIKRCL